jgi:hypothetical protein
LYLRLMTWYQIFCLLWELIRTKVPWSWKSYRAGFKS